MFASVGQGVLEPPAFDVLKKVANLKLGNRGCLLGGILVAWVLAWGCLLEGKSP